MTGSCWDLQSFHPVLCLLDLFSFQVVFCKEFIEVSTSIKLNTRCWTGEEAKDLKAVCFLDKTPMNIYDLHLWRFCIFTSVVPTILTVVNTSFSTSIILPALNMQSHTHFSGNPALTPPSMVNFRPIFKWPFYLDLKGAGSPQSWFMYLKKVWRSI